MYAHNTKAERHKEYRAWLQRLLAGPEPYGVSDHALTAVVRIITDPRIFIEPTLLDIALQYAESIRFQEHAQVVAPGARFWHISPTCAARPVFGASLCQTHISRPSRWNMDASLLRPTGTSGGSPAYGSVIR